MRVVVDASAVPTQPSSSETASRRVLSQLRPILRRGLARTEAAVYLGISPSKFDELVDDKRMPQPRLIDGRKVWDLHELDASFDELPHAGSLPIVNSWSDR
jgi:excisionase family DNA binding protein